MLLVVSGGLLIFFAAAMGLLLDLSDRTASPRSVVRRPRERSPRAVARLVPVPRLIAVARPVKVPFVTPGIIARSIGTRRGSRRFARFFALRLRSRIDRDRYCIVERRSRVRLLRCGSLGEGGSIDRTLRRRGRGKLGELRTGCQPAAGAGGAFCSAELCASAGDFICCGSVGWCAASVVTGSLGSGATKVRAATDSSATGRSSNENTVAAPAVAPMIAATAIKRAVRMTLGAGAR